MSWLRKKRVLLLLFVGFVAVLFFNSSWMGKWLYPIHYQEPIRNFAIMYEVDPLLVAAIIRVESNYKPSRESKKGALGMMQVMPDTADWVMEKAKLPRISMERVNHEPEPNIQIGTWYLKTLLDRFDGNIFAAVAAYNAGPTVVARWIDNGVWDGRLETAKKIPYGETKHYVQRVVYYYNKYKEHYSDF